MTVAILKHGSRLCMYAYMHGGVLTNGRDISLTMSLPASRHSQKLFLNECQRLHMYNENLPLQKNDMSNYWAIWLSMGNQLCSCFEKVDVFVFWRKKALLFDVLSMCASFQKVS